MVSRLHYLPDQMSARIELGAGAPAELVRLLPLLGLEPVPVEPIPSASRTASEPPMPPALRVEFGLRHDHRDDSSAVITIALLEPGAAFEPVAEPVDSPDFVCDSAIAAACFILSRALRLPSSVLTTNPRLFNVVCAAVALAHSPAGILVEGEIGVGKESMVKLIHAASGDPESLLYAECAGLEATAVATEISPLLAPDAGSDYHDAKLSYDPHHLDDHHLDDRRDDADSQDAPRTAETPAANLGHLAIPLGRTIFFNHLGELSLAAQRNLLDLLRSAAPRIRLLAASVQPLAVMVARGEFRADLRRLFDATLTIIPLRDRPGDLPMLARHLLRMRNPAVTLDAAAIRTLERYPFPGNLRELTNFVTRLAIVPAQPRRLTDSPPENVTIGRAEIIRQLDHPSLKLLWPSRHHRAASPRTSSRRRHPERLASNENNLTASPADSAPVSPPLAPPATVALRLTTTAVPRHRHPRVAPKSPA